MNTHEALSDAVQMLRDIAAGKSWDPVTYWDRVQAMERALPKPTGVESVSNEDAGCGDLLVVRMKNGWTVVIDAQDLGHHQCQVGLYRPGTWDGDDAGEPNVAGMVFDPVLPVEVSVTHGNGQYERITRR